MRVAILPQFVDQRLNNGRTGKAKESAFDIESMNSKALENMCYAYQSLSSRRVSRLLLDRISEIEMQGLRIIGKSR